MRSWRERPAARDRIKLVHNGAAISQRTESVITDVKDDRCDRPWPRVFFMQAEDNVRRDGDGRAGDADQGYRQERVGLDLDECIPARV